MGQIPKRAVIRVLKLVIAAVVLVAVGRHVAGVLAAIRGRGMAVRFGAGWLIAAGVLYLAGLAACGRFYERVVRSGGGSLGLLPALRAYLVSHLGKYVPGKAMVVVVRVALSTPFDVRTATAAAATFYETLVMMAAGGLVSAVCLALAPNLASLGTAFPALAALPVPLHLALAAVSLAQGLGFLIVTTPAVFDWVARHLERLATSAQACALPRLSWALLAEGLALSTVGWALLGLSLLAVIESLRGFDGDTVWNLELASLATGGVAFATVAGFVVAVLPGGLGLREGVLMSLLTPALGSERSVVAALALRLVWVAAEIAASLAALPWLKPRARSNASPGSPESYLP